MWKSSEAFEKSTFFKRLHFQGFQNLGGMWEKLQNGDLKQKRSFRLNPFKPVTLKDFRSESFAVGPELTNYPNVFEFDLETNKTFALHPFWGAGLAYVQDPVALEIIDDLSVEENHRVFDVCAAPGGKSFRIAEKLNGTGWLIGNDADYKRARIYSNNLIRYSVLQSTVFCADGTKLAQSFDQDFDRVLVDAPCSGESLFFKRQEKRRDVYESEVQECVAMQNQLLAACSQTVAPGGRLVYSTCTYNLSENEEVVRRFVNQHRDFSVVKEERRWPQPSSEVTRTAPVGTAGGYWAVLQRAGTAEARSSEAPFGLRQDCIRNGISDSKGKLDLYAQAMDSAVAESHESFSEYLLMANTEAQAFLRGESLNNPECKRGLQNMLLRGKWALGPAKGVDFRFNNLLPLEARVRR